MGSSDPSHEYEPFPNVELRNSMQFAFEVPLMARMLDVPERARILEVGCGRGIALAALARLRAPERLVGVDLDPEALWDATRRTADAPVPTS
jgi:protein-L-isoaspartate O-methyltransferase